MCPSIPPAVVLAPHAAASPPDPRPVRPPAETACPGILHFQIPPPYAQHVYFRPAPVSAADRLPFGTVLGIEVTSPTLGWPQVEKAVRSLAQGAASAPVVLMIDPASEDLLFVASRVARLPVRAVLFRDEPITAPLRKQLTRPPSLPDDVVDWLALRGTRLTPMTRHLIREIFVHAREYHEIVPLLRALGNPESSARFRCRKKRLPSPGRWLHVARALDSAFHIQAEPGRSLLSLARELGYADHSALSNQMLRVFRLRPGEIRRILGWEWLMERWLTAETAKRAGRARSVTPGAGIEHSHHRAGPSRPLP